MDPPTEATAEETNGNGTADQVQTNIQLNKSKYKQILRPILSPARRRQPGLGMRGGAQICHDIEYPIYFMSCYYYP